MGIFFLNLTLEFHFSSTLFFFFFFFIREKRALKLESIPTVILMETLNCVGNSFSFMSSFASHPLFSSFIALYILILLYSPPIFLGIAFSPVSILTGALLITILRLGAAEGVEEKSNSVHLGEPESSPVEPVAEPEYNRKWVKAQPEAEVGTEIVFDPCPLLFVESNVTAPLEVIYEDYEGEEEEKEGDVSNGIQRFLSLSQHYPESDSDSSSDGQFPSTVDWNWFENMCFRLGEEEQDELIEIELDRKRGSEFRIEEENLIEIDISPGRNYESSGEA